MSRQSQVISKEKSGWQRRGTGTQFVLLNPRHQEKIRQGERNRAWPKFYNWGKLVPRVGHIFAVLGILALTERRAKRPLRVR
jgi:hypothetical protein